MSGTIFYLLTCFQGPMHSLRSVNAIVWKTDWISRRPASPTTTGTTTATRPAPAGDGGGVALAAVAKYVGHSTIQMTMRYSHLVPKVNQAAVDGIDAFYASGVGTETDTITDTGTPASFLQPDK